MANGKNKLIQVSLTESGAYFIYELPKVVRGIRGKNRERVDEVLIHGVPKSKLQEFCIKNEIQITNLAVYQFGLQILKVIPGSSDYNETGGYNNGGK